MYHSYTSTKGSPGNCDKTDMFGHSKVPILGGVFTPTIKLMHRDSGEEGISFNNSEESEFGELKGPTCFGGCLSLCRNAKFKATSNSPTNPSSVPSSLGMITKLKGGAGLEFRYVQTCKKDGNSLLEFTI